MSRTRKAVGAVERGWRAQRDAHTGDLNDRPALERAYRFMFYAGAQHLFRLMLSEDDDDPALTGSALLQEFHDYARELGRDTDVRAAWVKKGLKVPQGGGERRESAQGGAMATTFMVTVSCDEQRAPNCHRHTGLSVASPREFDRFATELFQQGWVRGFRNTNPAPDATSDTLVAYDVCPACMDEKALEPVPHERQPGNS